MARNRLLDLQYTEVVARARRGAVDELACEGLLLPEVGCQVDVRVWPHLDHGSPLMASMSLARLEELVFVQLCTQ